MAQGPMSSVLVTIRSPSGSESPFRITIRIREELPQFYYAGVRRRSELSERLLVFLLILPFQFHYG